MNGDFYKKNNYSYIDTSIYGLRIIFSAVIICILNITIKPIIFKLTLPLTAITYGLFYPVINVIILYITSLLLRNHFVIHNILMCFVIAIIISVLKYIIENILLKIITRKG